MRKKVYICKSRENEKEYFVNEDTSLLEIYDEWFEAYTVIWGDFERAYWDEIGDMTFDEMKSAFYEFERDWVNMEPNFGLTNKRDEKGVHLL